MVYRLFTLVGLMFFAFTSHSANLVCPVDDKEKCFSFFHGFVGYSKTITIAAEQLPDGCYTKTKDFKDPELTWDAGVYQPGKGHQIHWEGRRWFFEGGGFEKIASLNKKEFYTNMRKLLEAEISLWRHRNCR